MLRSVFVVAVSLDGDGIAHACVADAWDIQENAFVPTNGKRIIIKGALTLRAVCYIEPSGTH